MKNYKLELIDTVDAAARKTYYIRALQQKWLELPLSQKEDYVDIRCDVTSFIDDNYHEVFKELSQADFETLIRFMLDSYDLEQKEAE